MNDNMLSVRLVGARPQTREAFRAALEDRKTRFEISDNGGAPGLLVLEIGEIGEIGEIEGRGDSGENRETGEGIDFEGGLARVRTALERQPGLEVFLVARDPGRDLLLAAMRAGVKEVLAAPVDSDEIRGALDRVLERRERLEQAGQAGRTCRPCHEGAGRRGAIIDVIGAKGGVGATTLAVNLAASLAGRGAGPVLIMDLNLAGGEVPLFLDLAPAYHWGEAFRDISRLDESFLMSLVAKRSETLYVLPAPSSLDDLKLATPEAMSRLLGLLRSIFSAVVIDGGQYLDEVSLAAVSAADAILLVMVQNMPCLASVKRFLQHVRQAGDGPGAETGQDSGPSPMSADLLPGTVFRDSTLKLVVNRCLRDNDLSVADLEQAVARKTFWQVPNDYKATLAAMNHGRTLDECAPKSPVAASLRSLADTLVPPAPSVTGRASRGLFGLGLFARLGLRTG
jgi:pilus assembly protein CpaE